jgi:hypothetical protein
VAQPESHHTSPSSPDGDGVRVIRESGPDLRPALAFAALALAAAVLGYWQLRPSTEPVMPKHAQAAVEAPKPAPAASVDQSPPPRIEMPMTTQAPLPAEPRLLPTAPDDARSGDANDIATYVSPTDPEPTAAELIQALRDSGETGGLAAFNPPGTSPPMVGLAVPEDFPLPDGYVRHHQVTDDGQPIEAILMFAPDFVLRDASGGVVPIPEDRVVPPELAPPGLALRQVEIPPPPE